MMARWILLIVLLLVGGPAMAQAIPVGAWFPLGQGFSGRVVAVQLRASIGLGTALVTALPGRQFLLLTLEARNDGHGAMAPPVLALGSLTSLDGRQTIPLDPLTARVNTEPSLGARAHTAVPPGAVGRLTALYQVPRGLTQSGFYYAARPDGSGAAPSLATLPH